MNYYEQELSKIDTKEYFPPTIKIKSGGGYETKWLNLNDESANELVKWLKDNYKIVEI